MPTDDMVLASTSCVEGSHRRPAAHVANHAPHTITKASLATYAGTVSEDTMERVCEAVSHALGF